MIGKLLLLAAVGVGSVAAYNHWSDNPRAAAVDAERASRQAARLANQAVVKASDAAGKLGDTVGTNAVTVKIKSKMALDDYVKARAIDVDTSGTVVTLSGVVQSDDERQRALRLARETAGVKQVIDRLEVKAP